MKKDVYKYNQVGQSFNVKEKIYESTLVDA